MIHKDAASLNDFIASSLSLAMVVATTVCCDHAIALELIWVYTHIYQYFLESVSAI